MPFEFIKETPWIRATVGQYRKFLFEKHCKWPKENRLLSFCEASLLPDVRRTLSPIPATIFSPIAAWHARNTIVKRHFQFLCITTVHTVCSNSENNGAIVTPLGPKWNEFQSLTQFDHLHWAPYPYYRCVKNASSDCRVSTDSMELTHSPCHFRHVNPCFCWICG